MDLPESIEQSKEYLKKKGVSEDVEAAVILGSGLSGFASSIQNPIEIPYHNIPYFPRTSVQGHDGTLISGTINNHSVITFSGRFHHYEGHEFSTTVLPVHITKVFNAKKLVISNAAGAVNPNLKVGDLMVIEDLFRLFQKISTGPWEKFMYNLYDGTENVRQIAAAINLDIQRGTYLYVKGPNYETKAEIRAFQKLGVDVVGMSTAPELMEAARLNIPAVAISLVTNMAAGLSSGKLDHSEVKITAEKRKEDFTRLVKELIRRF